MGADLYIKSITDAAHKKYTPVFDAAVAKRDALVKDLDAWQSVVAVRERIHGGLPGLDRELQAAKSKIEVLNGQIAVVQKEVSRAYNLMYPPAGYYRDSYNGTSVLWRLELSWWNDVKGGVQTVASLSGFLSKIKSRKLKPLKLNELKAQHCKVDNDENNLKSWSRFYQNKKRRLIRFLTRALERAEKGEEVYFSV